MFGIKAADFGASFVVLLVAIPFCACVSAASGVGLQAGLITAMVGGLVVGPLGGARLQVSGPAVSLAAVAFAVVGAHGAAALGPAVLLAGMLQVLAGLAGGGGGLARLMPPVVLASVVCASGLAQAVSQLVALTGQAGASQMAGNLLRLPAALAQADLATLLPGVLTLALAATWQRLPQGPWRAIPGPVAAVLVCTAVCAALPWHVPHIGVPPLSMPHLPNFGPRGVGLWAAWRDPDVLVAGCLIAAIGTAESLASAEATIWAAGSPVRLGRNRELVAQGLGNTACALLGGLPLSGAIPRSAANMRAGAQGAASNVLHAVWLLAGLALAPALLRAIPAPSLVALLVMGGWRLAFERTRLSAQVKSAEHVAIFVATLLAAWSADLAAGVATGCALAWALKAARLAARQPVASGVRAPAVAGDQLSGAGILR